VHSGLILAADDEAELAGVMAHEIAHVAARHATRQMTRSTLAILLSIPRIFVGGGPGVAIQSIARVAAPMGFMQLSRGFERWARKVLRHPAALFHGRLHVDMEGSSTLR
jgi:predicted Zn-dependent protease